MQLRDHDLWAGPMRVIPYLRQSEGKVGESADDSLSLDSQLARVQSRAETEHWTILPAIRDHDLKGDDPDRPGIKEMWRRVSAENPDAIVVFAMSRFARDNVWQELTWRKLRSHGVHVISLTEPNIDHTLMRGLLGVVNQYQSEQIGQFVRAAFERRAASGLYHGEAPYGYLKVHDVYDGRPRKVLSYYPEEAPTVTLIYDWFLAGWTGERIATELNRLGIPPRRAKLWSANQVRNILRHPVYCGDVRFNGKVVARAAHPAIVPREKWEEAQAAIAARPVVKTRNFGQTSWLEGLVLHGCGARMYRTEYKNPREQRPSLQFSCRTAFNPPGQKCDVGRRHIGKGKVERATRICLAEDLARVIDLDAAIERAEVSAGGNQVQAERARLSRQHDALQARRDRAESLYTTGRRPLSWFDQEDAEIQAALDAVSTEQRDLPQWPDYDRYAQARELLTSWSNMVLDAPGEDVAYALRKLGSVMVEPDCVHVVYHEQFRWFIPEPHRAEVGRWGPSTYLWDRPRT